MSNKQRLVLSIIDFLNQSIQDGTVKQDDKESLEVAIQCIGEAFEVDPTDQAQVEKLSVKPATLPTIFDVFLKTRDKLSTPGSSASAAPAPSQSKPAEADKAAAETKKAEGNALMSRKNFSGAIEAYTEAIALDPTNPVYYSNRAAAHSSKGNHADAIVDAEKAIELDSTFVKAYHRLGHAYYSLGDFSSAASAFGRGLELDPNNASLKSGLQNAEARITSPDANTADASSATTTPGLGAGGLPDMLRNMGMGGGAGGGMPDLASMMNNPMMMQMAQQMMQNGGLERLMQNPALANMMNRVQSGNMPSMEEIMSDPTMRQLASQFGGGGGASS